MVIDLVIYEDYVSFQGKTVSRPLRISRSRWQGFWQLFIVRGITVGALMDADRFMRRAHDGI